MRLTILIATLLLVSGCASEQTTLAKKVADIYLSEYKECMEKNVKKPSRCEAQKKKSEQAKSSHELSVSMDEQRFAQGMKAFADGMQEYRETNPQAIMNDSMIHGGYGSFGSSLSYHEASLIAEINKSKFNKDEFIKNINQTSEAMCGKLKKGTKARIDCELSVIDIYSNLESQRRAGVAKMQDDLRTAETNRLIQEQNRKLDEINNRLTSQRYGLVP